MWWIRHKAVSYCFGRWFSLVKLFLLNLVAFLKYVFTGFQMKRNKSCGIRIVFLKILISVGIFLFSISFHRFVCSFLCSIYPGFWPVWVDHLGKRISFDFIFLSLICSIFSWFQFHQENWKFQARDHCFLYQYIPN